MTAAIDRLFDAMRKSDTAAVRAAFLPGARVIPMSADNSGTKVNALELDAFVRFAGQNAAGAWDEQFWSAASRTNVSLGDLWFEYDVYRGETLSHCGVNSVQLQRTGDSWKIVSMAFTRRTDACRVRPK